MPKLVKVKAKVLKTLVLKQEFEMIVMVPDSPQSEAPDRFDMIYANLAEEKELKQAILDEAEKSGKWSESFKESLVSIKSDHTVETLPSGVAFKEKNMYELFRKRIEDRCGETPVKVQYSAYQLDDDLIIIDNMHEIAVQGKVIFRHKRHKTPVLENPTWLDLCVLVNERILETDDHHHCFLEGVCNTKETDKDGIPIYRYMLGS